jgi:hypothetical protein
VLQIYATCLLPLGHDYPAPGWPPQCEVTQWGTRIMHVQGTMVQGGHLCLGKLALQCSQLLVREVVHGQVVHPARNAAACSEGARFRQHRHRPAGRACPELLGECRTCTAQHSTMVQGLPSDPTGGGVGASLY